MKNWENAEIIMMSLSETENGGAPSDKEFFYLNDSLTPSAS